MSDIPTTFVAKRVKKSYRAANRCDFYDNTFGATRSGLPQLYQQKVALDSVLSL